MEQPDLIKLQDDLRVALALKADDLLFTVGGNLGERLQDEFLGVACGGHLASDLFLSSEELAAIHLDRFQIAAQVRSLVGMLESRSLALTPNQHVPDLDSIRQDGLEFFEHFLSTLPRVALGAWDATSIRNGALRRFYEDCSAWANLVEAVETAFYDGADLYSLRVADLARLSGLEMRTMRNRVGPAKPIRTTPERKHRAGGLDEGSFVGVNTLDALNWLSARREFSIQSLDPEWAERRLAEARDRVTIGRAAIVLGLLNIGSLAKMAADLGWTEKKLNDWAELGPSTDADEAAALAELIGLKPQFYSARCSA